ncbi:MAG: hypothetical protein IKK93_12070 [Campylobacter sp.]|nr:hypothetical protein [Campylobacter sp.]
MMEILICGYGNIGKHLYQELLPIVDNCEAAINVYDKYKNISFISDPLYKERSIDLDYKYKFDYCFICVSTEQLNEVGDVDISEVVQVFNQFKSKNIGTYIIKSAVPVGFCEKISLENVIISPEYWGTTQHCPELNFLILGGKKEARDNVVYLYNKLKNGYYKYYFTDWKTAELVKYMENCWIATKVTFCNEFAEIAKGFDIDYNELRELWLADSRVSPSHTLVYPDKPYFDSHCLNKDVPALINFCEKQGIDTPLMKWVLNIRDAKKEQN